MPLFSHLERERQAEERGIEAGLHATVHGGVPEGAVLATVETLAGAALDYDRVDAIRVFEAIHHPDERALPLRALPPVRPLAAHRPRRLERAVYAGAHRGRARRRLRARCR